MTWFRPNANYLCGVKQIYYVCISKLKAIRYLRFETRIDREGKTSLDLELTSIWNHDFDQIANCNLMKKWECRNKRHEMEKKSQSIPIFNFQW